MVSLLQEKMIGLSSQKKNIWLEYSVLSIIIIIFGVPPEAKALPHAIRIGAIFTGKTRNKNPARIYTNYTEICVLSQFHSMPIYFLFTEDQKDSPAELAFKYAIYKINRDQEVR